MALTDVTIRKLRPGPVRRELSDGIQPGLRLIVQPSGAKSWAVRYRFAGRPCKLTLGRYPGLTLGEARKRARAALTAVDDGKNPAADKRTARDDLAAAERNRVAELAERFLAEHVRAKRRPTYVQDVERIFKREILPAWRTRSIASITRADVKLLIGRIAHGVEGKRDPAPFMADRVRAALSRFFSWCIVEEEVLDVSPVKGTVRHAPPNASRDRVLTDAELARVWNAAGRLDVAGMALFKLLILTGARRGEIAGLQWPEIDVEAATVTLAGERTKNGEPHVIPLSEPAVGIVAALPKLGAAGHRPARFAITIAGTAPVSSFSKLKRAIDAKIAGDGLGAMDGWTVHDLRRTAASGLARLGTAPHVVEAVLNHRTGTIKGVARVYNRYGYDAEKRAALEAWGAHVLAIAEGRAGANVVVLARG